MMNKQYFIQLSDYNIWANNIFCNMLSQVSEEQWLKNIISSFNSIQETTLHIISAENAWLQRVQKKEKFEWLQSSYKGTKEEHLQLWKKTSSGLKDFITHFNETDLHTGLYFKRLNGDEYTKPFYQIFAHVFNHATYHRGQLVTMLRQVGYTAMQSSDLMGFYK